MTVVMEEEEHPPREFVVEQPKLLLADPAEPMPEKQPLPPSLTNTGDLFHGVWLNILSSPFPRATGPSACNAAMCYVKCRQRKVTLLPYKWEMQGDASIKVKQKLARFCLSYHVWNYMTIV